MWITAHGEFLAHLLKNFKTLEVEALIWYSLADNYWMWSNLVEHGIPQPAYEVWKVGLLTVDGRTQTSAQGERRL
jgi:hypothetical protein